jgi:hypothetical protein
MSRTVLIDRHQSKRAANAALLLFVEQLIR